MRRDDLTVRSPAAPAASEDGASAAQESSASAGNQGEDFTTSYRDPTGQGGGAEPTADDQTVISKAPVIDVPAGNGAPAEIAQVLLGHQLGHFHLEELIGGGGMGAVFRGRDERLERTVAIKVIPRVADDPDLLRRFRNEAQSAARLDHPHIARVYDVGQQDGWHYIVFEFIQGTNVRDLVNRTGVLSIDEAVYYTRQVAEALQHAWRRGVVHRDVKPSNVLVTVDGQVKLVDMGLARSQQFDVSEDLTASGVTLGTFDYISPEQARDPREADVRSDLYSLGCTLYFMLTGRPPFPGGTLLQKLLSHGGAPPPDPRGFRAEVSRDLCAVLRKLLSKRPEDRYQEPVDLIADLYELASREELVLAHSGGTIAVRPPSVWNQRLEHHLPWVTAVGALVLSVAMIRAVPAPPTAIPEPTAVPIGVAAAPGEEASEAEVEEEDSERPGEPSEEALPSDAGQRATEPGGDADAPAPVGPPSPGAKPPFDAPLPGRDEEMSDQPEEEDEPSREPGEAVAPATIAVGGDADRELGSDVIRAETLRDALRRAASESTIEAIELHESIESVPVRIPRDGLVIRSAPGVRAEIHFRDDSTSSMERPVMVRLDGHGIDFQGVHLVWKVPLNMLDGGSLFALSGNDALALRDSSITIDNSSRYEGVHAIDVQTDAPSRSDETEASLPLVVVDFENCVVRGQMTMVSMDLAASLQIRWQNGLLAINGPMVDTAGAPSRPPTGLHKLEVEMERVTAYTPEGLIRMRLGPSGREPMLIERVSRDCVFIAQSGVPLVKVTGLRESDDPAACLEFRGSGNAYDTAGGRVEGLYEATEEGGQTIAFWHYMDRDSADWFDERTPSSDVRWTAPHAFPPDKPTHAHEPDDYAQEGAITRGFRTEPLPVPPPPAAGFRQPI